MSEFEFFKGGADRWGDSMKALWNSLEICPPTDHIGLPCHTAGELHSIGHLKVWEMPTSHISAWLTSWCGLMTPWKLETMTWP